MSKMSLNELVMDVEWGLGASSQWCVSNVSLVCCEKHLDMWTPVCVWNGVGRTDTTGLGRILVRQCSQETLEEPPCVKGV